MVPAFLPRCEFSLRYTTAFEDERRATSEWKSTAVSGLWYEELTLTGRISPPLAAKRSRAPSESSTNVDLRAGKIMHNTSPRRRRVATGSGGASGPTRGGG